MTTNAQDLPLEVMVNVYNQLTEPIKDGPGLVLTLAGQVVSGKLMPNWQWFQELEESTTAAMLSHDPDADPENIGLGAVFRKYGEAMRTRRDEHDAMREAAEDFPQRYTDALRDADRTEFIHLREARVYGAGANPLPGNGMLWRGRLSDVAGWSFGLLGATPA